MLHGFVWVNADDGRVVQVDPSTNQIVDELKVDTAQDTSHYYRGADGTILCACSAAGIVLGRASGLYATEQAVWARQQGSFSLWTFKTSACCSVHPTSGSC